MLQPSVLQAGVPSSRRAFSDRAAVRSRHRERGPVAQDSTGTRPKEHAMTIIRRTTKSVITLRPLLAAAVAAVAFAVPSHASAGPAPVDPPGDSNASATTYSPAI